MAELRAPAARVTAKLRAYLAIAALGVLAALVFGRPELVAATAPLAVYVALGLAGARRRVEVTITPLDPGESVRQGEAITVEVEVRSDVAIAHAAFKLVPGPGLRGAGDPRGRPLRIAVSLTPGQVSRLRFRLLAERWGAPRAGELHARLEDRFGVVWREIDPVALGRVAVLPAAETLRELLDARQLRATVGSRVSPGRGEGIEFAEVREFQSGDAVRRINWRVSARRGALHVSDRHPELGADVVLLLDTFSDLGEGEHSTLLHAVRAAASLAAGYIERRDRVGVVGFGGILTGLGPRLGTAQLERLVGVLIASEAAHSYAVKQVATVPRGLLPPRALVVALTPLVDPRMVSALFDLCARGFDLAILEFPAEPYLAPPRNAPARLAERLWRLRRDALRERLRALGVTLTTYDEAEPLQIPLIAAAAQRRRPGRALPR